MAGQYCKTDDLWSTDDQKKAFGGCWACKYWDRLRKNDVTKDFLLTLVVLVPNYVSDFEWAIQRRKTRS